jgi:hypothetical protein
MRQDKLLEQRSANVFMARHAGPESGFPALGNQVVAQRGVSAFMLGAERLRQLEPSPSPEKEMAGDSTLYFKPAPKTIYRTIRP